MQCHKEKNRKCNGQMEKDKKTVIYKTKDPAT